MRIETRTKIVPQQYNVFIADDGTEFAFRDDCEKYEESKKKIEVEGIVWYDRYGKVLPLILASWKEVVAIRCEDYEADQHLYNVLEALGCDMDTESYAKFSAYGDSPLCDKQPCLLLYNSEEETWEDVGETYSRIKKWLDVI